MRYSPAVTIVAIAACSAQNPVPECVSLHVTKQPIADASGIQQTGREVDQLGV